MVVLFTIVFYNDYKSGNITVSEVYGLLALLGAAFRPLKNIQKLLIAVDEGLHSIKRIEIYMNLP